MPPRGAGLRGGGLLGCGLRWDRHCSGSLATIVRRRRALAPLPPTDTEEIEIGSDPESEDADKDITTLEGELVCARKAMPFVHQVVHCASCAFALEFPMMHLKAFWRRVPPLSPSDDGGECISFLFFLSTMRLKALCFFL